MRGVAVGVQSGEELGGGEERGPRPSRLLGSEPMLCNRGRRGLSRFEPRGDLSVERSAARPCHGVIEGLARQRVAKGPSPWLLLEHEAALDRLLEPLLARELEHEPELETEPRNGRDLERLTRLRGESLGPQKYGVADGLGQGEVRRTSELDGRTALSDEAASCQRAREFFDEKRNPLSAVVNRGRQRRTDLS